MADSRIVKFLNLKEELIEWMDNALELIDSVKEENFKLRMRLAESVKPEVIIKEVIKEVQVEVPVDPVIRIQDGHRVCQCQRMEVEKHAQFCYWCLGEVRRKRAKATWEKKKNEIRPC